MDWVESQINDENIFPVKVGESSPFNYLLLFMDWVESQINYENVFPVKVVE